MNIDKNLLGQLAALDDKSLAAAIRMFALSSGINIGELDAKTLNSLRTAMRGATDKDIESAKKLFEGYKKQ